MPHRDTMNSTPELTRLHRTSAPSKRSTSVALSPVSSPNINPLLLPPSYHTSPWSLILHAQDTARFNPGRSTHTRTTSGYPSPPSTDPHLQSSIPLPIINWLESTCFPPPIRTHFFGGILDSPPVMYHEALKRSAPLSPPATLPTSTSALPVAETDPYHSSPLDDDLDLPGLGDDSDSGSPLLDVFTPGSGSSCSTLLSPLSPTSPEPLEWHHHGFPCASVRAFTSSPGSALLHNNSIDTSPTSSIDYDGNSLLDRRLDKQDPIPSKRPLLSPLSIPHHHELLWEFCHSPKDVDQPSDLEPIDLGSAVFPPIPRSHTPELDDVAQQEQEIEQAPAQTDDNSHELRQLQQQLDAQLQAPTYRQGNFPHPSSPSIRNNSLPEFDDDSYYMDIDIPENPPASPSLRSYTMLPEDELHPDEPEPSYPNLDDDLVPDTPMLSPPASPSPSLLALPGAEADDDLIALHPTPTGSATVDHHLSTPTLGLLASSPSPNALLIIDDDSPSHSNRSQRSPSPEPCTLLDMSLVMNEFPEDDELRRICGLLRRTRDAERAARQMEVIVEEEERVKESIMGGHSGTGTLDTWSRLMDARRKTKRRKEKVREIATLLRLKLAQRGWRVGKDSSGKMSLLPMPTSALGSVQLEEGAGEDGMKVDSQQKPKGGPKKQHITSPQQLLVKMIMDRHEPRYNSRVAGPGLSVGKKTTSPLAKGSLSFATDEVGTGAQDEDAGDEKTFRTMLDVEMRDDDNDGSQSKNQDLDDLDLDLDLGLPPMS